MFDDSSHAATANDAQKIQHSIYDVKSTDNDEPDPRPTVFLQNTHMPDTALTTPNYNNFSVDPQVYFLTTFIHCESIKTIYVIHSKKQKKR